jgi:RNA polymerase sigma-70 factor, ECF subfamily
MTLIEERLNKLKSNPDFKLVNDFLKTRSERDFSRLYNVFSDTLYRVAMSLTNYDSFEAYDVLQEAWITIALKLEEFRFESRLKTWMIGIVYNKFRERKVRNRFEHVDLQNAKECFLMETGLNAKMDMKIILTQLPDGYKEILILHDLEGFKHAEISELLGISIGTSKSQLFHARKAVEKFLKDEACR